MDLMVHLCVRRRAGSRNYIISNSYLNKFREDLRVSLPAFQSGLTLISKGAGTCSPEGGHCVDMDRAAGQRWSFYCQHSYSGQLCQKLLTF